MLIASIPYTGSFLCWAIFPWSDLVHLDPINMPWIRNKSLNGDVVIPQRDPYKTAESWTGKGESIHKLLAYWKRALSVPNGLYLPIDTPLRDQFLGAISNRLQRALSTDWKVVNSKGKRRDLYQYETDLVASFIEDNSAHFESMGYL